MISHQKKANDTEFWCFCVVSLNNLLNRLCYDMETLSIILALCKENPQKSALTDMVINALRPMTHIYIYIYMRNLTSVQCIFEMSTNIRLNVPSAICWHVVHTWICCTRPRKTLLTGMHQQRCLGCSLPAVTIIWPSRQESSLVTLW